MRSVMNKIASAAVRQLRHPCPCDPILFLSLTVTTPFSRTPHRSPPCEGSAKAREAFRIRPSSWRPLRMEAALIDTRCTSAAPPTPHPMGLTPPAPEQGLVFLIALRREPRWVQGSAPDLRPVR